MALEALPMPGPFWGPILAAASGVGLAIVLGWLAGIARGPTPGWRQLRPGAMHWTGLVLSAGLAALMGYIVRYVGSSRTDGATQMQILGWMALAFAAGTVLSLLQMYRIARAEISWGDGTVRFRPSGGDPIERPIAEIESLAENRSGWFVATFADDAALKIDPYAKGADALLQSISDGTGFGRSPKL